MARPSNSKLVATAHLIVMLVTCCIELIANTTAAQTGPTTANNDHKEKISIVMPDIRPDHGEQYLCMAHRVKKDQAGQYVVGFNPQANAERVHHMLLYGCQMPGILQRDSPNFVWDCSEMHVASSLSQVSDEQQQQQVDNQGTGLVAGGTSFEQAPVCQAAGKQQILYGWALDAPALSLPPDVGFKIGGQDSGIDFLVLQVHYGHYDAFQKLPSLTDNSGLILNVVTPNDMDKSGGGGGGITRRAGVLLLFSLGYVPKGSSKHEIWCELEDDIEIHPFRFRVHTHKLGTRVRGTKISQYQNENLGYDVDQTSLIGVGDPQEPQMFYPVHDPSMTLTKGDKVYATCEFNNNRDHNVKIGATNEDEMCNFYMMYWTNSSKLLSNSQCSTLNPQRSYLDSLVNSILF